MLERGVSLAPSQFEAAFVSLAHTTDDLEATIAAARESWPLRRLRGEWAGRGPCV